MIERSKKPSSRARAAPHEFAVVLESVRAEFRVFGEALQSFRENVDARFDQVDARLGQIDTRFVQVDCRWDMAGARFDGIEHDIVLLKDAVLENTRELKRVRIAVDKKVDRDELEPLVESILRRRG